MTVRILQGDCIDVLPTLDADSIDSCVTDPPYHLTAGKKGGSGEASVNLESPYGRARITTGFMGKEWDGGDVAMRPETWAEVLRVLKPGAYLLAFGGTRTHHRVMCAIEDAGFEIRDVVSWVYSSGFPKSFNVDRERGNAICGCEKKAERPLRPVRDADVSPAIDAEAQRQEVVQQSMSQQGLPVDEMQCSPAAQRGGELGMEGRRDSQATQGELQGSAVRARAGMGEANGESGRLHHGASVGDGDAGGPPAGTNGSCGSPGSQPGEQRADQSGALPDERGSQARGMWPVCAGCGKPMVPKGLGTALKPAWEPIIVARKPLSERNVTQNVIKYGTGAMNIDECRIATDENLNGGAYAVNGSERTNEWGANNGFRRTQGLEYKQPEGRWPANLIHDGSEEVTALFPADAGASAPVRGTEPSRPAKNTYGEFARGGGAFHDDGLGSAARFFYCAKADREDRNEGLERRTKKPLLWSSGEQNPGAFQSANTDRTAQNHHPTVKPTDLMRYLVRLVTRPGGKVLDPFCGSGSTGKACAFEGMEFVGIEQEAEYVEIARERIRAVAPLFAAVA